MLQPPWTDVGRLQQQIDGKANSHEVSALNSRLANLEYTVGTLRADVIGIQHQLEAVHQTQEQIKEALAKLEDKS